MPRASVQVKGTPALVIAVLTAPLALGAGGFAAWWSSDRRTLAHDAASFTPVPATVASIDVQEHHGRHAASVRCSPLVRYSYDVDGRTYDSDTYAACAPRFPSEADLRASLDQIGIRPGATVEAFCDPSNPARAVLSREVDRDFIRGMWGLTAAGIAFVAVDGRLFGGPAFNPGFRAKVMGR